MCFASARISIQMAHQVPCFIVKVDRADTSDGVLVLKPISWVRRGYSSLVEELELAADCLESWLTMGTFVWMEETT